MTGLNIEELMGINLMNSGLNNSGGSGSFNEIITKLFFTLFNMLLISLIKPIKDIVQQYVDKMKEDIKNKTEETLQGTLHVESLLKKKDSVQVIYKNYLHSKYQVFLNWKKTEDEDVDCKNNLYLKALLYKFSKLHHIPNLYLSGNQFVPNFIDKPFEITDNLICVIRGINFDMDNLLHCCKIELYSDILTASEIASQMHVFYNEYEEEKELSLNNNIYMFNIINNSQTTERTYNSSSSTLSEEKIQSLIRADKISQLRCAPNNLIFEKVQYFSNRTTKNVFGNASKKIFQRLNFFIDNSDWYKSKGIPYQISFMLSGKPGTGKTSTIKAISNKLKRHIINISFDNIKTSKQLYNLFNNEYITFLNNGNDEKVKIPFNKRLYVLEEIDTLGNIVLDRKNNTNDEEVLPGQINLGDILNILDGNNEYPERVIIVTSNYPELLDKALIRGGRMDVNVRFEYPNNDEINEYVKFFFDKNDEDYDVVDYNGVNLSYADLSQICFSNDYENIKESIKFNF